MNKSLKIVLNVVLVAIILILSYLVYESIMHPLRFNQVLDSRRSAVIANLKDIREVQKYYRQSKGSYANDFTSLLAFAEEGKIPLVRIVPDPTDSTNTRSISDTIGYVSVKDSLFGRRENFKLKDIAIVPYSNNVQFELKADTLERSGIKVYVFEAKTHNDNFLKNGAEKFRQDLINLNNKAEQLDKYPGLKVGSLTEVTTDGNWENL
ncbi:MAG: hypothetical protein FWF09_06995 [Bacteroidales bacterium]|jgi:hypothetical protein|nr:hypothetical protein [Bacteroidales bacterium]